MVKHNEQEIYEEWVRSVELTCRDNLARTYLITKQSYNRVELTERWVWYILTLVVIYLFTTLCLVIYEKYYEIFIVSLVVIVVRISLDFRLDRQLRRLEERKYEGNK